MTKEASLEVAPITKIQDALDSLFAGESWWEYEHETLALELQFNLTTLLDGKLWILKICNSHPEVIQEDPTFLIYAAETLNNHVTGFDRIPYVNSLELAFAIDQLSRVLIKRGTFTGFTEGMQKAVSYFLREEGYSEPVSVFGFIDPNLLSSGQTPQDTADKQKAISEYIQHMESL